MPIGTVFVFKSGPQHSTIKGTVEITDDGVTGVGVRLDTWLDSHRTRKPLTFWSPMTMVQIGG